MAKPVKMIKWEIKETHVYHVWAPAEFDDDYILENFANMDIVFEDEYVDDIEAIDEEYASGESISD